MFTEGRTQDLVSDLKLVDMGETSKHKEPSQLTSIACFLLALKYN